MKMEMQALFQSLEDSAEQLLQAIHLPTDYSVESLEVMENIINAISPTEGEPTHLQGILPFGYYFGETVIRAHKGAKWSYEEAEQIWDVEILVPNAEGKGAIHIKPFLRILKYWRDRTDGIAVMFRTVSMVAGDYVEIAMENSPEGEWKRFKNGDAVRILRKEQVEEELAGEKEAL
jgi:hypothetical protein